MGENSQSSQDSTWDNDIKFVLEVRNRPCLYDDHQELQEYYCKGESLGGNCEDNGNPWASGNYPRFPSQTETGSQDSQEITLNEADEPSDIACVETPHDSVESSPRTEYPEDIVAAETSMAQASMPTENTTVTPVVPGKRRHIQQDAVERVIQAMQNPVVIHPRQPAPQALQDSEILHFLKSLQGDMGRASPRALMKIKMGMLQLIQKELDQDTDTTQSSQL